MIYTAAHIILISLSGNMKNDSEVNPKGMTYLLKFKR
jgi:hypothetical protein